MVECINDLVVASDDEDKTVVYSILSKRSSLTKIPVCWVTQDASSSSNSSRDIILFYSINPRDSRIEI